MNIKHIISFGALIALSGTQCWGAAPDNQADQKQMADAAKRGEVEKIDQLATGETATGENIFDQMPGELIGNISEFLDPRSFGRMAEVNKKFKDIITKMPLYQLLKNYKGNVQQVLINAAEHNKLWAIDYLLCQEGVDINAAAGALTALLHASVNNHGAMINKLIQAKANVNATYGFTPLMLAAAFGRDVAVAQLLAAKANANAVGQNGKTALMLAARSGRTAAASQLLTTGADVNVVDRQGRTALMLATENGHEAVVSQLAAAGASVDAVDRQGKTALMLATAKGHAAVISQLAAKSKS